MPERSPTTPPSTPPPFHRSILAALVCIALIPLWRYFEWNIYCIAAAALFALPSEHRTRENAMLVGWSVGFGVELLIWTF